MTDRTLFLLKRGKAIGRGFYKDREGYPAVRMDRHETLDFVIDWSSWLDADTIDTHTVQADGITIDSDSNTGTTTTVWLSSLNRAASPATVTQTIETTGGRTKQQSFRVYERDHA